MGFYFKILAAICDTSILVSHTGLSSPAIRRRQQQAGHQQPCIRTPALFPDLNRDKAGLRSVSWRH
jgi:hypothetical protein